MNNTENVVAQLKQIIIVLQAAVEAIDGVYQAKVTNIVDQRLTDKDKEITDLREQLTVALAPAAPEAIVDAPPSDEEVA